jgi:hypothetical protein
MPEEVVRAFVEAAPVILGNKKSRKLMRAMRVMLKSQIPPNGVGPVIGARREAVQFLESAIRVFKAE